MTTAYWQAKIWGLLHDPALKALHNNSGRGGNSFWQDLAVMAQWKEKGWNPEKSGKTILKHIKRADYITSASDRSAIGSLSTSVNYNQEKGLEISHLLSGEKLTLKLKQHDELIQNRLEFLTHKENQLLNLIPPNNTDRTPTETEEIKRIFWWLWRCLPEATFQAFDNDSSLLLMPAETRFPDASLWSHVSLTAAMAGALAGYNLTPEDIEKNWKANKPLSHAYLTSFTFSPIQELIKASRKMRDLWAGSWILHYLSAKVSWKLANIYGADCLIYPNLYNQPLIDHWLLQEYPEFSQWIPQPTEKALLTAGFPNVLILVLPKDKVQAAMQTAKSTLIEEWLKIGKLVFEELHDKRYWMKGLSFDHKTWKEWLKSQWQVYWTAVPIGVDDYDQNNQKIPLTSSEIYREDSQTWENNPEKDTSWRNRQNQAYGLNKQNALFLENELEFLQKAAKLRQKRRGINAPNTNIGSWWNHIFDQTRLALTSIKNGRCWELPTAFSTRSTISGIGSVVHPDNDWISEGKTKDLWKYHAGLFDGKEQLNATESVKRGLHLILPQLLGLDNDKIEITYPDLTSGVAGYLHQGNEEDLDYFYTTCQAVVRKYKQDNQKIPDEITEKWGIPWADNHEDLRVRKSHPRLLNAGWLIEDLETESFSTYREELRTFIDSYYPQNNPTNWYVLAVGDGDGMSEWLKGTKMKPYRDYLPDALVIDSELQESFAKFQDLQKRMGPSTHNALSRALLDFSNQLVPYLTEERYAGRLIYSGGDDVLAYTNLWEWDNWLWDIRQCFKGDKDPKNEFTEEGNYWKSDQFSRPLFTMGKYATISFGIVIAHHFVPLAIALESLWKAEGKEEGAKGHKYHSSCSLTNKKEQFNQKDAVQIRVIYGNGNILKSTAKFETFHQWQKLVKLDLEPSLFEQAANLWEQHPIPVYQAIEPWIKAFCNRREQLRNDKNGDFEEALADFIKHLWLTTPSDDLEKEVKNWLKLTAFVKRNRKILDLKKELKQCN